MRHLLPALALLAACGDPFEPYSHIHSLSVLAIRAEPPEIAPGATADLDALVIDPMGRALTYEWAYCLVTPPPLGLDEKCVTEPTAPYLTQLGTGASARVTMPQIKPADLGLPDTSNGFYLPVRLIVRAGGDTVTSIYRLRYGLIPPANQNPAIEDLLAFPGTDGGVLAPLADGATVKQGDLYTLRATFAPGSTETYQILDLEKMMLVPETELLRTTWFASGGSIDPEHTGEEKPDTRFRLDAHLPPSGPSGQIDLWVVVRDERGGVDWLHRNLLLQ